MNIGDRDFEEIIKVITHETGIVPRESHRTAIKRYVEERLSTVNPEDVVHYAAFFSQNQAELAGLINKATVNETYFFREERQLDFLKSTVFPALLKNNQTLNIWSAACSSGEEIYTLALVAASCKVPAVFTASDINTGVLEKCREGIYGANSVRTVDGAKYHPLLLPYKMTDGSYKMSEELKAKVRTEQINLSDLVKEPLPQNLPINQHIIFIRNVFIYFTMEMRAKIIQTLAKHCLSKDGYLFVSMNEIASIDNSIIPKELERKVEGSVFYFHKKC